MYHLIFLRKQELNDVNLTSTRSFPPFGKVVLLCFSTPHFKGSEVVMFALYIGFFCSSRMNSYLNDRGGEKSARLVRPFEKNLNLTIIGPTRSLKIQGFDISYKNFGPTKVGVVGPAPPVLNQMQD